MSCTLRRGHWTIALECEALKKMGAYNGGYRAFKIVLYSMLATFVGGGALQGVQQADETQVI